MKLAINKIIALTIFISVLSSVPGLSADSQPMIKSSANPAPLIEFKETTFDTGEIWEGENASHTFSFQNRGNAILRIEKVKTSCGCTAAILSSKEIEPGGTGEIKATFNTKRYRGKQTKTIYVSSNDPKNPTVKLQIQTTVKTVASFNPRNLQFGNVTRGEKISRIIEFIPNDKSVKIQEITATPDIFTARILPEDEKKIKHISPENEILPIRIEVTASPKAGIGRHNGELIAKIDHPKMSAISAHLHLRVEGPISYTPRMLFFDENAQKNHSVKKVRLTKLKGDGFKIVGVTSSSPQFQAEPITVKKGREFDVEIKMSPNTVPGRYNTEIMIKTDCPDQKLIKIPVRSNIRKK